MALVTHLLNVLAKEDKPVEIVHQGIYKYETFQRQISQFAEKLVSAEFYNLFVLIL